MWSNYAGTIALLGALGCGASGASGPASANQAMRPPEAGQPAVSSAGTSAAIAGMCAAAPGGQSGATAPGPAVSAGTAGPLPMAMGGPVNMASDPAMPAPAVTSCDGHALPERAVPKPGPYAIGPEAAGLPGYVPTDDFRALAPEKLGFDPAMLSDALKYNPDQLKTDALLVIRHGYIAAEQYFGSFTMTSRHQSFSMAKSFTSALIGIALGEKKIPSVDDKLCKYYPQDWKCDDPSDKHGLITIQHALTLTTGLEWHEDWRTKASGMPNDAMGADIVRTALRRRVVDEPGTKPRYSTADPALLRAVLEQATGMGVFDYARKMMFDAMGASGIQWSGDTYWNIQATAREYAKFAYLYLNHGNWGGKQLVPAQWVDDSTRQLHDKDPDPDPDVCHDWYYDLWHINLPNRLGSGVDDPNCPTQFCNATTYANLPPDGYFAEGLAGQYVFVIPSADLIVVRLGNDGYAGIEKWDAYTRGLLERILSAIH